MKTCMWLLAVSMGAVLLQQCTQSKRHETVRYSPADSAYIYAPLHSFYQIGFPQKPRLKDINDSANPHNISKQVANVINEDDSTILNAEFQLYSAVFDTAAKDKILALLKKEAQSEGLVGAHIYYDSSRLGDSYIIFGSKFVATDDPKQTIEMIFDEHWYYKKNNLFRVSAICPASSYPTKSCTDFEVSLKLVAQ